MLDAVDAEGVDCVADEIGPHKFSRVGFGEFSRIAGALPEVGCPVADWNILGAVEIDAIEIFPCERVFKYCRHFCGVAIVMDAEEDPHFEAGRYGRANRIADGVTIEVEKIDTARGKARFDVAYIAGEGICEDGLCAVMIAIWRVEKIGGVAEKLGFKMSEVAKTEIRCPRGGW